MATSSQKTRAPSPASTRSKGVPDTAGAVGDWSAPLDSLLAPPPVSFSLAAEVPSTANGLMAIGAKDLGRFRLWPYSIFQKGRSSFAEYAYKRPANRRDWRYAEEKAIGYRKHFDTFCVSTGLTILVLLPGWVIATVTAPWYVAACIFLGLLAAVAIFQPSIMAWSYFNDAVKSLCQADPVKSAQSIANKVLGHPDLERRWEGVLRHVEQTGVPVLEGDVRSFTSVPKELPSGVQQASPWRSVRLG